jgi:FkbM family methyltransferase
VFLDETTFRRRLSVVNAVKREIVSGVDKLTFGLPYYVARKSFSKLTGRRADEVWSKSPFARLVSPIILPDGNLLLWSWEVDGFWLKELVKEIYEDRVYERCFRVDEGDVVVDVGANVGVFTLKAGRQTGRKGRVIAFEPERKNYVWLCRNIGLNNFCNVLPVNVAVTDFDGIADFYVKDASVEHTLLPVTNLSYETRTVATRKIRVRRLLSVLNELGVDRVDFLKIDAEGVELEVLRGAKRLLADKRIRKVSVATYHDKEETKAVGTFLRSLGYLVRVFRNEGQAHFQLEHLYGYLAEDDLTEKSVRF